MSKIWCDEGPDKPRPPLLTEIPPLLPGWVRVASRWGWVVVTRSGRPAPSE